VPETIPLFKVFMSDEAVEAASYRLKSGYIGEGPQVETFESILFDFLDLSRHRLLAVNSCTSALQLALHLVKDGGGSTDNAAHLLCNDCGDTKLRPESILG
jgi:dTDP-4-amino-4,6-dideoxygalactose transaminase